MIDPDKYNKSYLIDTHILYWYFEQRKRLSSNILELLDETSNNIYISSISIFEMENKHRLGKWPEVKRVLDKQNHIYNFVGFSDLPINYTHTELAGQIHWPHKDPFDRILVAQSLLEKMPLITADKVFLQVPLLEVIN